jgi:hypothetical protein
MNALTPRAFDAIIAQMECRCDQRGLSYAMIDGVEWEFCTLFRVDWNGPFSDYPGDPIYWQADCDLIGAWAFDPDTDQYRFAGNRAETVALLGEETARRWEREAQEEANE